MLPDDGTTRPGPALGVPWSDVLLVGAAAILVYLNALSNGFTLDDRLIIVDNATVHDLSNQVRIWLTPYWPGAGGIQAGLYRPLAILGFAVQWAVSDGRAWVFHLVSIGLHALCTILVLSLLRLFVRRAAGLAGAVVFAVHPVHVEAVANVVGQAELLAAGFVLLASVAWAARPRGRPPPGRTLGLVLAAYVLGMLAKEHAVVLPALLLALDVAQGRTREEGYPTRLPAPGLALGSVAAVYLALRWVVLAGSLSGRAPVQLDFLQEPGSRLLTALSVWPEYLRLLVAPFRLSFTYDPGVLPPPSGIDARVAFGAVLLALTAGAILSRRAWPRAGLGAAWFLVSVLPVSNLILPIGTVLAERTLYLPSVALALWVGFGADAVAGLRIRSPALARAVLGAAAVWTLALAGRAVARNPAWASNASLVARGLETHPGSFQVRWFHAIQLWEAGDTVSSRRTWARALEVYDGDAAFLTHYAQFRYATGDLAGADALLSRALRIEPGRPSALHVSGLVAVARGDARTARSRIQALEDRGFDGLARVIADSLAGRAPPGG